MAWIVSQILHLGSSSSSSPPSCCYYCCCYFLVLPVVLPYLLLLWKIFFGFRVLRISLHLPSITPPFGSLLRHRRRIFFCIFKFQGRCLCLSRKSSQSLACSCFVFAFFFVSLFLAFFLEYFSRNLKAFLVFEYLRILWWEEKKSGLQREGDVWDSLCVCFLSWTRCCISFPAGWFAGMILGRGSFRLLFPLVLVFWK